MSPTDSLTRRCGSPILPQKTTRVSCPRTPCRRSSLCCCPSAANFVAYRLPSAGSATWLPPLHQVVPQEMSLTIPKRSLRIKASIIKLCKTTFHKTEWQLPRKLDDWRITEIQPTILHWLQLLLHLYVHLNISSHPLLRSFMCTVSIRRLRVTTNENNGEEPHSPTTMTSTASDGSTSTTKNQRA